MGWLSEPAARMLEARDRNTGPALWQDDEGPRASVVRERLEKLERRGWWARFLDAVAEAWGR
jgi:hypothetical protein